MKKIFLSAFVVASMFAACTSSDKIETPVASNVFIENKVNEFVKQHPEWTNTDGVSDEITDKFQHEVKRWSNEEDFLKGMPLQLKGLRDTLMSGQTFKIGTFTGYNDTTRPMGSVLNYIQVQIDGILNPDLLAELKVDGKYNIEGMMYRQGSRKDVKIISVADFKGYDLGKYTFSVTKATPIQ